MPYRCRWNWFWVLGLLAVLPLATAMAQFEPELELREFEGSPRMVRVEGTPPGSSAELFRVYQLDADGRISKIEQGTIQMGVTMSRSYTYDDKGLPAESVGDFMGNPTNTIRYTRDEQGREVRKEWVMTTSGKMRKALETEYDDRGMVLRETLEIPGRKPEVTTMKFDDEGRLNSSETRSGERLLKSVRYVYTDKGCIKKKITTMPSGREEWREWSRGEDCRGNLVRITAFTGSRSLTEYVHDERGNVKTETTTTPETPGSEPVVISWTYEFPESKAPSEIESKKAD